MNIRAAVAKQLHRRIAPLVDVKVVLPNGETMGPNKPNLPVMTINDENFYNRLGNDLKIGLGESFMANEWTAKPDLAEVLTPYAEKLLHIVPGWMRKFRKLFEPFQPKNEENNLEGSKSNISRHYDLSNDLFQLFLDETMMYSSANFAGENPNWNNFAKAQIRKIEGILDFAGVKAGMHILEIGTGWGQLAMQAAYRGAKVHSITLSKEQKALADKRIAKAGLSNLVTVEIRDYRDLEGEYDAVVSVEMIEAVGEKYWPTYFDAISNHLKRGGRFGLQAITMPHDRLLASKHAYTWIHKYIFPGGIIPSREVIDQFTKGQMKLVDQRPMGMDYAYTLKLWRDKFMENRLKVKELGFDEEFERMWQYYLAYSEAGFRAGHLNVWQLGFEKL
ncbi:MAG: class I SAM-dependent methyltransferase [Candidatus Nanopelagicaceae bacterium]|jgi:cyclopropane-fatty-acyl-phospholipid synthase